MKQRLTIRDGRPGDSPFIARCILAGIGLYDFEPGSEGEGEMILADGFTVRHYDAILQTCLWEESLYSYRNARIAEVDGRAIGCLVSYPGECYARLRETTWGAIEMMLGGDCTGESEYETGPGEYYLDTLAIIPEYRGNGYGKDILVDSMSKAEAMGYEKMTLLVEKDHPRLIAYYESLGFRKECEMTYLDEQYYRCAFVSHHASTRCARAAHTI